MHVTNLRQSGNQDVLGYGPRSISKAGCMLTCFAMAVNTLNDTRYTPTTLNITLMQANAFVGSGLVVDKVAKRLGLKVNRTQPVIDDIFKALDGDDALVMLGVDYKSGASSGFSDADHFVLAYRTDKDAFGRRTIVAADPATGHDVFFLEEDRREAKKEVRRLVCRPAPGKLQWVVAEALYLASAEG